MSTQSRGWLLWWCGVTLVPVSGIVMSVNTRRCVGFWPVDIVTHHRCVGFTPTIVWLLWLLAFALMTGGMFRLERARLASIVMAQFLAGIAFVLTPTMPTADAYQYHVYGATAANWNPWRPTRLVSDRPAIVSGLRIWGNPPAPSPYGPVLVVAERGLLDAFPGLSADQLIYVERCVGLLAVIAVTLLLRGARISWWALHPLVLFEFALAAHCDVLMLLLVAVSLRTRNAVLAGIAIGFSAMVKIVGLGASAFRWGTIVSAVATVVAILAFFPAAATLAPQAQAAIGFSGSPALVLAVLLKACHAPQPDAIARIAIVIAGALAAMVVRTGRRDAPFYATLLLIGCSTWILPWYLTWVLLAARFAHRRTAVAAAVIASASLILEAGNQVAARAELAAALIFLTTVVISLRSAWRSGAAPRTIVASRN